MAITQNSRVYGNNSGNDVQLKVNADGELAINLETGGEIEVVQATHDDLNANANLQVGNVDVANGNPVPVSDAGGALSIDVGGVVPGLDNTNEFKVSNYVKTSAAGDTALTLGRTTKAASLPVTMASDQDDIKVTLDSESVTIGSITAGDTNIGNVDIVTFPAGNLGQQAMAASLSVVPANNVTDATYIGDIKFGESLPAGTNNIGDMDLASALSSEYDTIDVSKMSKGSVTTAHSAITGTATSNEIDCRGFNAISVEMAASALSSGNWVASILGCAVSGGTFGACYSPKDDGSHVAQATPAISANGNTSYYFKGIPNYTKILATRTTDGTLTCKCTPINL